MIPDDMTGLLTRRQVSTITGLSRTTLWRYVDEMRFPEPRRTPGGELRWLAADVQRWIHELPPESKERKLCGKGWRRDAPCRRGSPLRRPSAGARCLRDPGWTWRTADDSTGTDHAARFVAHLEGRRSPCGPAGVNRLETTAGAAGARTPDLRFWSLAAETTPPLVAACRCPLLQFHGVMRARSDGGDANDDS
jgi:prophage regulatory protein